jgi:hypothetical protein
VRACYADTVPNMSNLSRSFTVRVPETFPKRLKIAAAVDGVTLGEMLDRLLDQRERKMRRMPSPLHRVDDDDN